LAAKKKKTKPAPTRARRAPKSGPARTNVMERALEQVREDFEQLRAQVRRDFEQLRVGIDNQRAEEGL
jgi:archaellum biogenesis protein FlaJ (TadC family)